MRLNLSLGFLASLQLIASLGYQLIVLALLGAGPSTDAWVGAQAVPGVIFAIFVGVVHGAWQGRLASCSDENGEWLRLQRTANGQVLLLCIPAFIALTSTSKWWIDIVFIGFDAAQVDLASRLSFPLLAASVISIQCALATAALRGRDRFILCEVITLATNVASIAIVGMLIPVYGIEGAAWLTLARSIVIAIILFFLCGRPWPSLRFAIEDSASWFAARPLLAGGLIYKSGPLIDRIFASTSPVGGMTIFNFSQMGASAVGNVLERAITIPLAPKIARLAKDKEWALVASAVRTNLLRGLFVPIGAATCILVLSPWWVDIFQFLLNLDVQQARESLRICLVFTLLLYPLSVGSTIVSSLYIIGETKTVARVGIVGFILSLLIKYISFKAAGLIGLAIGICLYHLMNFLVMVLILKLRLNQRSME